MLNENFIHQFKDQYKQYAFWVAYTKKKDNVTEIHHSYLWQNVLQKKSQKKTIHKDVNPSVGAFLIKQYNTLFNT